MRDQQRAFAAGLADDVHKVQLHPVHLGGELGEPVQLDLGGGEIVPARPIAGDGFQEVEIAAIGPARIHRRPGKAIAADLAFQAVQPVRRPGNGEGTRRRGSFRIDHVVFPRPRFSSLTCKLGGGARGVNRLCRTVRTNCWPCAERETAWPRPRSPPWRRRRPARLPRPVPEAGLRRRIQIRPARSRPR